VRCELNIYCAFKACQWIVQEKRRHAFVFKFVVIFTTHAYLYMCGLLFQINLSQEGVVNQMGNVRIT
jgi:hypothetical protein